MSGQAGFPAGRAAGEGGTLAATARGFREQVRVINALLIREMQTRFGHNKLGFLWLFIEPLLLASAIAAFKWSTGGGHAYPGVSPFVFALVSYLPYFMFRAIIGRAPGTLKANMSLLYHSKVKLIDVVLARHCLETAATTAVMGFIVVGVVLWGDMIPNSIPMLFFGLLLLFLLANGLGLMAAAAAAVSSVAEKLIQPLIYLSLPFSGALVALHSMDPMLRGVLLWNPQANIHEMVREGFFGDLIPSYFDIAYVVFACALVNLLGLAALRAVRPKLEF